MRMGDLPTDMTTALPDTSGFSFDVPGAVTMPDTGQVATQAPQSTDSSWNIDWNKLLTSAADAYGKVQQANAQVDIAKIKAANPVYSMTGSYPNLSTLPALPAGYARSPVTGLPVYTGAQSSGMGFYLILAALGLGAYFILTRD